jgi:hypothetical protein
MTTQKIYSHSIIKTVKALAGFEVSNVAMVGSGGTKKISCISGE